MLWKNVTFKNYFLASAVLSLLSILAIFISKSYLPPVVPIFFGKPFGAEQLGPFWFLFLIPAVSIVITVINLIISTSSVNDFLRKILAIGSVIISLMAAVTVIKIIALVGFF